MTTQSVRKTVLKPDAGLARAQLEELASRQAPQDSAAGERLRAVAAELVRQGLEVTVVEYQDVFQELEAVLPQARQLGPVTLNRDAGGTGCQLSWEEWADIADEAGARRAADIVTAVLRGVAPDTGQGPAGS
jgi:hypothetical protein